MLYYKNPFRRANGLYPGRIDMGVDFGVHADSPVFSIGPGVVVRLDTNASWPGGHYIAIRLGKGKAKGKVFYLAEHVSFPSNLHIGDHVTAKTFIATLHEGFPNCEIGWCKDEPDYPPLAYGCYQEGERTAAGNNMAALLHKLGAPMGLDGGRKTVCALPDNWPRWV